MLKNFNNTKLFLLIVIINFVSIRAYADDEVLDLSIEELMDLDVSSVSRKDSSVMKSAAAVSVITAEDIKRTGARNIPEALKGTPGLHVVQSAQGEWAITARGFNGRYANKLLVLIDGRSVYSHIFAGVLWNELEVDINNVERIEVIRGPGAAIWGANAVNGVINIITKTSEKQKGTKITLGAGTEAYQAHSFSHGDKINNIDYSLWATYNKFGDSQNLSGSGDAFDDYHKVAVGIKTETKIDENKSLTFQTGMFRGEIESAYDDFGTSSAVPFIKETESYYLLGKWVNKYSEDSDLELQFFIDNYKANRQIVNQDHTRFDLDLKHRFPIFTKHELSWGIGYRHISDSAEDISSNNIISYIPESTNLDYFSSFVQGEFRVIPETFNIILGSKLEHNDFTGVEVQPNIRFLYTPNKNLSIWSAFSRAVRIPTRSEEDILGVVATTNAPGIGNISSILNPNDDLESEVLNSYEVGARYIANSWLSFDLATYYSNYNKIIATTAGDLAFDFNSSSSPSATIPLTFSNPLGVNSYGAELSVDIVANNNLTFSLAYAYSGFDLKDDFSSMAVIGKTPNPINQLTSRASWNPLENTSLDLIYHYYDSIEGYQNGSLHLMDLRLAYQISEQLEIAILGKNLLDSAKEQYIENAFSPALTQIEREVFLSATYKFN